MDPLGPPLPKSVPVPVKVPEWVKVPGHPYLWVDRSGRFKYAPPVIE